MRISHETYDKVFGAVYLGMLGNLLVAIGCAPLLIGLFATDPAKSWPLLIFTVPLCAPAIVAAFAMFARFSQDGPMGLVSTFFSAWRASLRRAAGLSAAATLVVVVLSVDVAAAGHSHAFAIAIPLLLVVDALVVATALLALVGLAERPDARVRDLVRPAIYLAARRWYLTVLSMLAVGILGSVVAMRPVVGLGFGVAPMLYVVWANSRFTLQPVLHVDAM